MNNKMGRPPLPKGQSKDVQLGVRFNPKDNNQIEKAVKESGQTKTEWVRNAAIAESKAPPIWVKSKWKAEELNGSLIEFRIDSPKRLLGGVGELKVRENALGEISVDIFIDEPKKGISTRIWLAQDAVDRIELNPKLTPAKFRLLG